MPDDVIETILAEHHRIRELLSSLDPQSQDDGSDLGHTWSQAAALLLVHIDAAEEVGFPPALVRARDIAGHRAAIIADHADIRDAVAEARFRAVGSRGWWLAVEAVRAAARRHMDLSESTLLRQLGDELSDHERAFLARQWKAFVLACTLDAGQGD